MSQSPDTVRVFVALDLAEAAKATLAETMRQLKTGISAGVRWVDPAGIHLTLKFLGNIDPSLVDPIFAAMGRSARGYGCFRLNLDTLGAFPNQRQPRVLWAGVGGELAALNQLQERVDQEVSGVGFDPERRRFNPHLTLGRVRDGVSPRQREGIGASLSQTSLTPCDPWKVAELHLIQSNLTPQGAYYTSMGSVPLNEAG